MKLPKRVSEIIDRSWVLYEELRNHKLGDPLDFEARMREEQSLLEELDAIAADLGDKELRPGMIYTEGVADGSAVYVVVKITKKTVQLELLPFGDAYSSRMVEAMNRRVPKEAVEDAILGRMRFNKLWASR